MDPEIRTALLKGAAYFAADVPGYDNGMAEEITAEVQYRAGRNASTYGAAPASLVATFFPRPRSTREWEDAFLSGNPFGGLDVLQPSTGSELLGRYDRVVMIDWNCLDQEQHGRLLACAAGGGQVVIAAGQLFCQSEGRICWEDPPREAFFRNGDLGELCGVSLAGGSLRSAGRIAGPCLIHELDFEPEDAQLHLYSVDKVAEGADVLVRAPGGEPVVVRHAVGSGSVVTVLGPSYSAALGAFAQGFFNWLARENRGALSYRVDAVTPEEARDLIVYRDTGRRRVALCNYWRRFDMTPRIRLRDAPAATATVERIDVWDVEGLAASWQSPARKREAFETWASLPAHSVGVVRYEDGDDENGFRFTWRAIRTQHFYASFDLTSSTTRRVGPVEVHTTRDAMHEKGTQPEEPDVRCWIDVRILDCPVGRWSVGVEVRDAEGGKVRSKQFDAEVAAGEALVIGPDVAGDLLGGWFVTLSGRRAD